MITWCIGIVIESKFFFSIRSMSVKPKLALQDEDAANFVTSVKCSTPSRNSTLICSKIWCGDRQSCFNCTNSCCKESYILCVLCFSRWGQQTWFIYYFCILILFSSYEYENYYMSMKFHSMIILRCYFFVLLSLLLLHYFELSFLQTLETTSLQSEVGRRWSTYVVDKQTSTMDEEYTT